MAFKFKHSSIYIQNFKKQIHHMSQACLARVDGVLAPCLRKKKKELKITDISQACPTRVGQVLVFDKCRTLHW